MVNSANRPDILGVCKYESAVQLKAACNNILCVLHGKTLRLFKSQVFPQEFFIISELNNQWYIEDIL